MVNVKGKVVSAALLASEVVPLENSQPLPLPTRVFEFFQIRLIFHFHPPYKGTRGLGVYRAPPGGSPNPQSTQPTTPPVANERSRQDHSTRSRRGVKEFLAQADEAKARTLGILTCTPSTRLFWSRLGIWFSGGPISNAHTSRNTQPCGIATVSLSHLPKRAVAADLQRRIDRGERDRHHDVAREFPQFS